MTISRYARAPILGFGTNYGTSYLIPIIRENIKNGNIPTTTITLSGKDRLDIIAGKYLGDSTLWWIIAAASNIGWSGQVPPGTTLKIPKLSELLKYLT